MIDSIISYVFSLQFANFICVIGVLGYLIKTRLIPVIDAGIKEKEDVKLALKELFKRTKYARETVEENTKEQKLYAQELLEKLKVWNSSIEQAREEEAKTRLQGRRAIAKLIQKQEETLAKLYLVKELTPVVINDATGKLIKIFSSENKQQDFLNDALKDLEQETA